MLSEWGVLPGWEQSWEEQGKVVAWRRLSSCLPLPMKSDSQGYGLFPGCSATLMVKKAPWSLRSEGISKSVRNEQLVFWSINHWHVPFEGPSFIRNAANWTTQLFFKYRHLDSETLPRHNPQSWRTNPGLEAVSSGCSMPPPPINSPRGRKSLIHNHRAKAK